jgi:hypothetical protein
MHGALFIAIRVVPLTVCVGGVIWMIWRTIKRSDEPVRLTIQWVVTGLLMIPTVKLCLSLRSTIDAGYDPGSAFKHVIGMTVLGMVYAMVWRHSLASLIAKPFASLYFGGQEVEARPIYSIAIAKRKRGQLTEAIGEIRRQLEKFPGDFEGEMMLAEIEADDMKDAAAAGVIVSRTCARPERTPRQTAFALNCLADWHLKWAQDPDAARRALQQIVERLPHSDLSAMAEQRIAHLADKDYLVEQHARKTIALPEGIQNLGLLDRQSLPQPAEPDAAQEANDLVQHLTAHPLDTDARERLATIYNDHYSRLDLATDQLEQLIALPNQPAKRVVHWLNRLADFQVRHACEHDTIRDTLRRIIDLYPDAASANLAENRINRLKLELKVKEKSQTLKLGSYEQDIGLNGPGGRA